MHIQPAHVFWLFGLSGAGKSTLAGLLALELRRRGVPVLDLDGDIMRGGVCRGLGFSDADRAENLRRSAEVAKIALTSHLCVIAAFITPLAVHRQLISQVIGPGQLSLVWVDAPLETCRLRDVKGLYAGARAGKVQQMTGLASGFEAPPGADLRLNTAAESIEHCTGTLRDFALRRLQLA